MRILNKKFTIQEFVNYLNKKHFGNTPPFSLVIHHTWKPKIKDWKGQSTILGLKKYYENKGWSAGPHIFVADDGIWLFTDMYSVGIHAGTGNATYVHKDGRTYKGYSVPSSIRDYFNFKLQSYSIGIEIVGDYDNKIWSDNIKRNALYCIKSLQLRLDISNENIFFHRDFSQKTCPGKAISKSWLFSELNNTKFADDTDTEESTKYIPKYDEISMIRAKNLGILNKIDSENRELIAIASIRTIDYLERRIDTLQKQIQNIKNHL